MRESHNYYRKRRLRHMLVLFPEIAFPFSLAPSRRFFATKLRERAVHVREDDEFDTLARSFDRNCCLETERLSGKGRALDKKRIIAIVDKRYRRVRPCDFCD